ncbi:MAG TPA: PAS domain S-box protein [Anaerolineales bacterium]|nr:PAS domain S-box protein [Anaerolineales bacterium]
MKTKLTFFYRAASRWIGVGVLTIGLLVFIGWLLSIPVLTSMFSQANMKANTALGFILCGITLWCINYDQVTERMRLIANACALITLLLAALTLGEYATSSDFGIDQLFIRDSTAVSGASFPGRLSPVTALNLLLLSSALLLLNNNRAHWLSESLTIMVIIIAGVSLIGYIYGVSSLYRIGINSPIALITILTFILLGLGILCSQPEYGLIRLLSLEDRSGILARRLLPAAIGIPILLGWLFLSGERAGYYQSSFGIALFALSSILVFSALIWRNSRLLSTVDAARGQAEEALSLSEKRAQALIENSWDAIALFSADGRILYGSPSTPQVLGYSLSEFVGRNAFELIHPEDQALATERMNLSLQQPRAHIPVNARVLHKSGEWRWLEGVFTNLLDEPSIRAIVNNYHDFTERKRDDDALRESESYSFSLLSLSKKLEQAQTYSEALNAALEQVKALLGYQNVWMYLLSDDKQSLRLLTSTGDLSQKISEDFATLPIKGDRFLAEIAEGKEPVLVEDALTDSRTNKDIVGQLGNRTIVNVPIVLMDRHLGAFGTGSFGEEGVRVPTTVQLEYLRSLASHMAVTIDRIHLLTERRQSEEQIAYQAYLLENVNDAVIGSDENTLIRFWNQGAERIFGWKAEEVLGRSAREVLRSEMINTDRETVLKKLAEQGRWRGEAALYRKDGTKVIMEVSSITLRDTHGLLTGYVSVNRDITDRKHIEAEIRKLNTELEQRVVERTAAFSQANSLLQMMLDHMPDQIYFKDAQSRFIRNSRSQATALGLNDPADIVGKSDFDFFPHAQQSFEIEQEIMRSGTPIVNQEELVRWPDGTETWVSTTKVPLRDQAGDIVGTFGISRDISERKRAELALQKAKLELEAANKELEAFSYSVSHDLRAPLRSVDGFSQAILEDYGDILPADGREFLERIRSATQRMDRLIDDMLNLSRVTRAPLKSAPVNLTKLAEDIAAELRQYDTNRNVNFVIAQNLRSNGDPRLLQIVLENLMRNAWKFTSKRELGEIEVGAREENGETVYFIRDNGAGFDMTYANKLFGAFQRLHAMTEFPGTGVGLATIQRIIHRHGGRVWAVGVVDQGATFSFTLPILASPKPVTPVSEMKEEDESIHRRAREII